MIETTLSNSSNWSQFPPCALTIYGMLLLTMCRKEAGKKLKWKLTKVIRCVCCMCVDDMESEWNWEIMEITEINFGPSTTHISFGIIVVYRILKIKFNNTKKSTPHTQMLTCWHFLWRCHWRQKASISKRIKEIHTQCESFNWIKYPNQTNIFFDKHSTRSQIIFRYFLHSTT